MAKINRIQHLVWWLLMPVFSVLLIANIPAQPNDQDSLAVLPFLNDGGIENLAYLSRGLPEWITVDLSQSKFVSVRPGDQVERALKGLGVQDTASLSPGILKEIAARLSVSHLITGSFTKKDDKFLITAELQNPFSEEIIKNIAAEFATLEEIPHLVDELTKEIRAALDLTPEQIEDDLDMEVGKISTSSPEALRHYLDGMTHRLEGRVEEAVSSYQKAIALDPEFALAYWQMGMAFPQQSLSSYSKKAEALKKAMELSGRLSFRDLCFVEGDYNSMTRYRYAQAKEAYERLLEVYPDDVEGRFNLGIIYFDIEEWEKAAIQFRKVIESGVDSPSPFLYLVRAYINPGLYNEAQEVLESYLAGHGDNLSFYLELVNIHRFRGDYDLAHKTVDKAISLYADTASCIAAKGDVYLYSGKLRESEAVYQKLIRSDKPQFRDLGLYRLAELYLLQGRFQESRDLARQVSERGYALGSKGTMRDRLSFAAALDAITGYPQEALSKLDILWETTLKDEELEWQRFIVYRKGLVYAETGRLDQAALEAEKLKELIEEGLDKKKRRLFLHLMGVIQTGRKNYRKAVELLEESLPMICLRSRLNIAVADSLASAYSGLGDYEKARKQYERMVEFPRGRQFYGDTYARSFYRLAKIDEKQDLITNAAGNYEKFLIFWKDADPGLVEIEDAKKSLLRLKGESELADEEKPRIVLLSMGGTIAASALDRMNITDYGGARGVRMQPQEWLDDLPELDRIARVVTENWRLPEDTKGGMNFEHWFKVARRLQELARDETVDGMVVTHGTNLMAETAWFMDLVIDVEKPIVFVGSQRPWDGISGDGPLNLYDAIRVAASPSAANMGVLHVMNDAIHTAREVTKTNAYRVQAFKSYDLGPVGFADSDRIVFYRAPLRRHTHSSEFHIDDLTEPLPKVEILYSYTEASGRPVDALVEEGVAGIVVDGSGAGGFDGGISEAVKRAQEKGVVVVATTRTRGGRVQDNLLRQERKIIAGDNIPPEKARILLRLALSKTKDLAEIGRIFSEY